MEIPDDGVMHEWNLQDESWPCVFLHHVYVKHLFLNFMLHLKKKKQPSFLAADSQNV